MKDTSVQKKGKTLKFLLHETVWEEMFLKPPKTQEQIESQKPVTNKYKNFSRLKKNFLSSKVSDRFQKNLSETFPAKRFHVDISTLLKPF